MDGCWAGRRESTHNPTRDSETFVGVSERSLVCSGYRLPGATFDGCVACSIPVYVSSLLSWPTFDGCVACSGDESVFHHWSHGPIRPVSDCLQV